MSDLFISYSRKDSEQALLLADRLRSNGFDVWIDQTGIEAATSWSKEIVQAIDGCKALMILISASSMASLNVVKEVSIAAEAGKKLLPVSLEDILLNDELRYHLAGIQRVAYTQFDAILAALSSYSISSTPDATEGTTINRSLRKSVIVLPFEDLSPTKDNEWFADGIMSELIDRLGRIKSLRLIDRQTSRQMKANKIAMSELAMSLDVRYFIEGSVRKFGDQIKVSASLLDFEEGEYISQSSHKGTFADVFEIQETVADEVVSGLQLHLGDEEWKAIRIRKTTKPEAFEFWLRGKEQFELHSREGYERALVLCAEAARIDPKYSLPVAQIANTNLTMYRVYGKDPERLVAAGAAIDQVRAIEGESAQWCFISSILQRRKGNLDAAEQLARRGIEKNPKYRGCYDALAVALLEKGQTKESITAMEVAADLAGDALNYFNLLSMMEEAQDPRLHEYAVRYRPSLERNVRLNPDNNSAMADYALVLLWCRDAESCRKTLAILLQRGNLDAVTLFNCGCAYAGLGEAEPARAALKRSVAGGLAAIDMLEAFKKQYPHMADDAEFEELVRTAKREPVAIS